VWGRGRIKWVYKAHYSFLVSTYVNHLNTRMGVAPPWPGTPPAPETYTLCNIVPRNRTMRVR